MQALGWYIACIWVKYKCIRTTSVDNIKKLSIPTYTLVIPVSSLVIKGVMR